MNQSNKINQSPSCSERPFFSAELFPYRSLGRRGFQILMLILAAVIGLLGLLFISIGAWPVFGFLGLDILIVWYAFRVNYRMARVREYVQVSDNEVYIRGINSKGCVSEFRFNPRWVNLSIEKVEDEGVKEIKLTYAGKGCLIGSFLNPCDLESFAAAFKNALETARIGRRYAANG